MNSERKAAAEVCRKAAQSIEATNDYSCTVLRETAEDANVGWADLVSSYEDIFDPEQVWDLMWTNRQDPRVLMLCFLAAMVETGDA